MWQFINVKDKDTWKVCGKELQDKVILVQENLKAMWKSFFFAFALIFIFRGNLLEIQCIILQPTKDNMNGFI